MKKFDKKDLLEKNKILKSYLKYKNRVEIKI